MHVACNQNLTEEKHSWDKSKSRKIDWLNSVTELKEADVCGYYK